MERMIGKLAASLAFCAFAASAQTVQSLESAPAEQNPAEPAVPATVTTTTESASTTTAGGNVTVINNYYGTAPGAAAAPAEPKGWHTHDGFYFNYSFGVGYGWLHEDVGEYNGEADWHGTAIFQSIKLGGCPVEGFALYALLGTVSVLQPEGDIDLGYFGKSSGKSEDDYQLAVFGVGLTLYGPGNLFVSPAFGFGAGSVRSYDPGYEDDSNGGVVVSLDVGKEWWVSANWGIGVALAYRYAGTSYGDIDVNDSGHNFGILLSATFN